MGSRCGPKLGVNVTKNLGQKLTENITKMTSLWEPKGDPHGLQKSIIFLVLFGRPRSTLAEVTRGRAVVELSPADPLGRALKSKDTIVQYDTKTDRRK